MTSNQFAQDGAEIGCHLQIASLEELFALKTGPGSLDLSAIRRATEDEHRVAVSVVRAGVAIFGRRSAELRHRDQDDVLHAIAHVASECSQRSSELIEKSRQLSVLIAVVIPDVDGREGGLKAWVGFE